MSIKTVCPNCKGKKLINYLINVHNDEIALGPCNNCKGNGYIIETEADDDYIFCYW